MNVALNIGRRNFDAGSLGVIGTGRFFKTRTLLWGVFLFAIALAFFFASILGARWIGLAGNWYYIPPIALPLVACWVYAQLVRHFERRKPWEFEISASTFSELSFGFVFGSAFITGMWLIVWALRLYSVRHGVWRHWFSDLIFDSYVSAVLEELVFRGVLLRILSRVFGGKAGVILSSILFGLAHFSHGSWLGILGIIINAGTMMGLLYVITGRLWMSIGVHLGFDFIETSVLGVGSNHGLLVSVPKADVATWLTGGTFGPDAAVPAMVFGLIVNVFLWRMAFKTSAASNTHYQS